MPKRLTEIRPHLLRGASALGVVFALAAGAANWQAQRNEVRAAARFQAVAARVAEDVSERMERYEFGLRGMRGAVLAAGGRDIRPDALERYVATRDVDREFSGARGFGVIWRVDETDEAAFVARARREGAPEFAVRQLSPHAGARYIIRFIEPFTRNRQALGLDIASEANRRTAADSAARSGAATLTAPITIVQATSKPTRAFLVLLPIYRHGADLATPEQREAAVLGWTYAPLVIDEVLHRLGSDAKWYHLSLRDLGDAGAQTFYESSNESAAANAGPVRTVDIPVFGRQWRAELRATPAFIASLGQTSAGEVGVLAGAGSALCALALMLASSLLARRRGQRLEHARRAAVVDASDDAIVTVLPDGTVVDWNRGAECLLGYPASEAIGRKAADLLLPPERHAEDAQLRLKASRGERVPAFDTTRRHRDGTLVEVSVTASPISRVAGHSGGFVMTLHDIREAQQARKALAEANARLEEKVAERTAKLDETLRDLRTVLDAMPSQIGLWDTELRNRMANRAYESWFGMTPNAIEGRHIRDVLGEAAYASNLPLLQAALRGEPQSFEGVPVPRPDGKGVRYCQVNYLPNIVDGEVRGVYTFVHDVTEIVEGGLKLAAAQRESAALLHTLNNHAIVSVADRAGNIVDVNPGFCKISGYSADELIGRNHRVVNSGLHKPGFWRAMWRTVAQGHTWHGEVCNRAKDGSLYWVDSVIAPFFGADGKIDRYISIRTDITPIKRLQQEAESARQRLEEASRFLREVTDRLPLRIAYVDERLRYRFVNAAHCRRYGRPREQILGRTSAELTGESMPAWPLEHAQRALRGETCTFEFAETLDSATATFESRLVPDRGDDGRVVGFFTVGTDVSERRRTDDELRRTMSLLRAVLDSATQSSIIAVRPDGEITVFNAGAERMLGYTAAEVVGRETSLKFHDPEQMRRRAERLSEELGRRVPTGNVLIDPAVLGRAQDWNYLCKDGRVLPVSLTVTAMRNDYGDVAGYLGIAHDVSQQREHERSLRQAIEKANRANRAKSHFLANMSHEIRTPMNAVIGMTYLLERTTLDAEQSATLAKIKLASRSLLGVINDVLDVSKIEAGEMSLEQAPFSLRQLLTEIAEVLSPLAQEKGIGFAVDVPDTLPRAVTGDVTRLRQVLTNLLSNAVKFTEHGGVHLQVQCDASSAETVRLRFVAHDTGIGIKEEVLARLFLPFSQADDSTSRRFGGTGLGLSIIKDLTELMGGEVGVSSQPGVGSDFWVALTLPVHLGDLAADPSVGPGATTSLRGVRVLAVDDSTLNLDVARRILELEQASVSVAADGQQAVDFLTEHPDGVDVVLMDVQMPVLDGLEATRRIREVLGLRHLPVIALTAGMSVSERERAAAAGVSDIVGKPFDPVALMNCIRRYVPGGDTAERAPVVMRKLGVPDGWPLIEGIDAADAARRLGGDVDLFGATLRGLFRDFADMGDLAREDAPPADVIARMHSLKGIAGTLGATSLARAAANAERAWRASSSSAVPLAKEVAHALQVLQRNAEDALRPRRTATPLDDATPLRDDMLTSATLRQFLDRLRRFDLGAVAHFKTLSPHIRRRLGEDSHRQLEEQITELRFDDAAKRIQALADELEPAGRIGAGA